MKIKFLSTIKTKKRQFFLLFKMFQKLTLKTIVTKKLRKKHENQVFIHNRNKKKAIDFSTFQTVLKTNLENHGDEKIKKKT